MSDATEPPTDDRLNEILIVAEASMTEAQKHDVATLVAEIVCLREQCDELEAELSREMELRKQSDAATERMRHKLLAVKEIVYRIETT